MNRFLENYNKGFSLFKSQKWSNAMERFISANDILPEDGPTTGMIKRCRYYAENQPVETGMGFSITKKVN